MGVGFPHGSFIGQRYVHRLRGSGPTALLPHLPPPIIWGTGWAARIVPTSSSIKRNPTEVKWLVLTLSTGPESRSCTGNSLQCVDESPETHARLLETTFCEKVRLVLQTGWGFITLWLGDWLGMAALSTGTGKATWGTAGCLWEEITETSQIRTSVFTPAAKCKMILSCQHLSPGLKELKFLRWVGGRTSALEICICACFCPNCPDQWLELQHSIVC